MTHINNQRKSHIARLLFLIFLFSIGSCEIAFAIQNPANSGVRSMTEADADIEAFGVAISEAWNKKDSEKVKSLIDFKALGERAAQEIFSTPREIENFSNAISKTGSQLIVSKTMTLLTQTKGTTRYIQLNRRGAEYRPVIRFELGESGYDYQECVIKKDAQGDYKIIDWIQLSQGELVSKTLTAAAKQILNYQKQSKENKSNARISAKDLEQLFSDLNKLELAGKYAEAAKSFEKLPPEILDSKVFIMKWVLLASLSQNDDLYKKTLAALAEKFGKDPSGAFMLIDYYFLNGDLDKSLEAISLVESDFIKDGVTTQLKAGLLYSVEKYSEVIPYAQESIDLEPDREDPYWILARSYIALKNYSEAVNVYKKMEENFGYRFASKDFSAEANMKIFVKSVEFKKWMKSK